MDRKRFLSLPPSPSTGSVPNDSKPSAQKRQRRSSTGIHGLRPIDPLINTRIVSNIPSIRQDSFSQPRTPGVKPPLEKQSPRRGPVNIQFKDTQSKAGNGESSRGRRLELVPGQTRSRSHEARSIKLYVPPPLQEPSLKKARQDGSRGYQGEGQNWTENHNFGYDSHNAYNGHRTVARERSVGNWNGHQNSGPVLGQRLLEGNQRRSRPVVFHPEPHNQASQDPAHINDQPSTITRTIQVPRHHCECQYCQEAQRVTLDQRAYPNQQQQSGYPSNQEQDATHQDHPVPLNSLDHSIKGDINRQGYYLYIPPSKNNSTSWDSRMDRIENENSSHGFIAPRREPRPREKKEIISVSPMKRFGWDHVINGMQNIADRLSNVKNPGLKDNTADLRVASEQHDNGEPLGQFGRGIGYPNSQQLGRGTGTGGPPRHYDLQTQRFREALERCRMLNSDCPTMEYDILKEPILWPAPGTLLKALPRGFPFPPNNLLSFRDLDDQSAYCLYATVKRLAGSPLQQAFEATHGLEWDWHKLLADYLALSYRYVSKHSPMTGYR
ncbi:hypothetical protein TWF102_010946 [Orbilia oligospora]|uniref:Uncharacterized protein n=1 Tax=Orbilia oligospora TaxID=2813651 RepID=A0A7C8J496_ORBOL|nr:hypothetical protein TWF706_002839 [Orbilia oligospora]KAF3086761.1 hypothetical protein TWF102_010946 [Orbilia oligospora]KAF3095796.1 hypothetical protein TWF103_010025 [Orbilia oligospora]KAF3138372.1 hypothetical protein TWF594_007197 [Orbilia oligospora]